MTRPSALRFALAALAITLAFSLAIASISLIMPDRADAITVKATKIELNMKSLTMCAGDSVKLSVAKVTPSKASKKVTWKSSKPSVASVASSGKVRAIKSGTCTITAKSKTGKVKAACTIRVTKKSTSTTKVLVAYFSATGTTKAVAEKIAKATGADLLRITPAKKYTSKDLNYNNDNSRANKEQANKSVRPQIKGKCAGIQRYKTIFIGFPIWWGTSPRIMATFLEAYDLSGKTIVPFCTSGSSGIGEAAKYLKSVAKGKGTWKTGKRLYGSISAKEVAEWVSSLGISKSASDASVNSANSSQSTDNAKVTQMIITANGHRFEVELEDNSSTAALVKALKSGPITVKASDYGNFEKVGNLGMTLPTNDKQITTKPGDVILYQGNKITVYYDTNTWSFTKLGHIKNAEGLKKKLGSGNVTLTLSLS